MGCKDTHQGADVMIGVFKWGYGSGGKSIAFWGWVEEPVGGWGQISKLVFKRASAVCAVADRGPLSVTGTNRITARATGADRGFQRFSTSTWKTAGISAGDGRPSYCRVEGSTKNTGSAVKYGVSGRSILARTAEVASTIVTTDKAQ